MKPSKRERMIKSIYVLTKSGIPFQSFNNGIHVRIGRIDFYPTKDRWIDGEEEGYGVNELIDHIKENSTLMKIVDDVNNLTPEDIFNVAKKSIDQSLFGICETIHKAIYKEK